MMCLPASYILFRGRAFTQPHHDLYVRDLTRGFQVSSKRPRMSQQEAYFKTTRIWNNTWNENKNPKITTLYKNKN